LKEFYPRRTFAYDEEYGSETCRIGPVASATAVPEIDAATGANALALLTGALLIIRGRKR